MVTLQVGNNSTRPLWSYTKWEVIQSIIPLWSHTKWGRVVSDYFYNTTVVTHQVGKSSIRSLSQYHCGHALSGEA